MNHVINRIDLNFILVILKKSGENCFDMIKLLVEKNKDILYHADDSGLTALHYGMSTNLSFKDTY